MLRGRMHAHLRKMVRFFCTPIHAAVCVNERRVARHIHGFQRCQRCRAAPRVKDSLRRGGRDRKREREREERREAEREKERKRAPVRLNCGSAT